MCRQNVSLPIIIKEETPNLDRLFLLRIVFANSFRRDFSSFFHSNLIWGQFRKQILSGFLVIILMLLSLANGIECKALKLGAISVCVQFCC